MTGPEAANPYSRFAGLPEERTELAWSRSGLALLVCFALLARHAWQGESDLVAVLTVVLLAAGALGWAGGILHARAISRRRGGPLAPAPAAKLRNVALGTTALSIAGVVVSFFPGD